MEYTGQSFNENSLVKYSGGTGQITIDNCYIPYPYYYPIYEQHYHNWYTSTIIPEKSKVEQAFKIVGKLLEKDLIKKELTVKEFIKLVNDIAEII
jgi:hypothetical protein